MDLLSLYDAPAVAPDAALVLEGTQIHLVPMRLDHASQIQVWVDRNEEGLSWGASAPVDYGGSAEMFVRALLDRRDNGEVPFVVESARTNELIGYTRYLSVDTAQRKIEIGGTWYVPHARGTATNPECKSLLLGHVFEQCGFNRVRIQTDIINTRSQRAIVRIGAMYEGVARADMQRRDGTVRDTWRAAIIRPDWPVVQQHLRNLTVSAITAP